MCRTCGKFSKPHVVAEKSPPLLDRCNSAISKWESQHRDAIDRVIAKTRRPLTIPFLLRVSLGVGLLLLSAVFLIVWTGTHGGFISGRAALTCVVIGTALLLGSRLLAEPKDQSASPVAHAPWLVVFGFASNLAVAQLLGLLTMIAFAYRGDIDPAWWTAIVVVGLGAILLGSRLRLTALVMGLIALLFLAGLWAVNDFGFEIAARQRSRAMPESFIPIGALTWTIMAIAVFPQLQLLRKGGVGIGRFKGDFVIPLFGSAVPVSITTAILLVALYGVVSELPFLPGWIAAAIGT